MKALIAAFTVWIILLIPTNRSDAAFAKFQLGYNVDEVAATTCNINTGVATGLDAGTCVSPTATCNGVADDAAVFRAFNTWAKATTANASGLLIELTVNNGSNCIFATSGGAGQNPVFAGVTKSRLMAYGATFTPTTGGPPGFGPAGSPFPPGICHKGITDASGCSARIVTVLSGAMSITLDAAASGVSLATLCARFTANKWAAVAGFDLQGNLTNTSYPPNPQFFDFVKLGSTTNCTSTGQILLQTALTNNYLSTWPNFGQGNAFEADPGGPATIYALDASWGGETDLRGFTLDTTTGQSGYPGRSVSIRDVTITGTACIIPSQNGTLTFTNVTGTNCAIEIDKFNDRLIYSNVSMRRLSFQSASNKYLSWTGGSLSLDMNGTPLVAEMTNLTTPTLKLAPYAYGVAKSATCTNCVITNPITIPAGVGENGSVSSAIPFYTVSAGGVLSYPVQLAVTAFADNGSGHPRLTVSDTTGWTTGATAGFSGLCTNTPGPGCTAGGVITIVDATHIDLNNVTFANVTWTGGGILFNSGEQERIFSPGANILPQSFSPFGYGAPAFQVTGVTQVGNFINIATNLPGGTYPIMPNGVTTTANMTAQMPLWRCINCSGNPQFAEDFSLASSARPVLSYVNRTLTNLTSVTSKIIAIGSVNTVKINVTDAYAGATNPMRLTASAFAFTPGSTALTSISWTINLRQAGLRTITPSGVTCDTGGGPIAGACSGDSGFSPALPSSTAFFTGDGIQLAKPNGSPVDDTWSANLEFDLDQGVVP